MNDDKIAWVQCAKGLTICLVVYGHAMFGVNTAVGLNPEFFKYCNDFFSTFRMPLFFFASGIFAVRSIARPANQFLNRTVLHFIYIYIVWCIIQYTFRMMTGSVANHEIDPYSILYIAYQPINVMWFVYVLLAFFLITRLLRPIPYFIVLPLAGALAVTPIESGSYSLDRFCSTYIFFLMGYYGSGKILELARRVTPVYAAFLVPLFTAVMLAAIYTDLRQEQKIWLPCAMFGILAMATLCICLSDLKLDRFFLLMGTYSLPIFVSHTIATAGTRVILSKLGMGDNPGLLLVGSTLGGVMLPILLAETCDRLRFPWLFRKPDWFTINMHREAKSIEDKGDGRQVADSSGRR
jgi:uncharacterized membrane protein YcfT